MARQQKLVLDEVGYWSEIKLDIIRDYAPAYSTILAAQEKPRLHHVYIDGFAGAGIHLSRTSGEIVEGSPSIAVGTQPPFREYHFVDWDGGKGGSPANAIWR
jgi:three-Cys-motif partner protein